MQPRFRGIYIPLTTPFTDDGEADFDALSEVTAAAAGIENQAISTLAVGRSH